MTREQILSKMELLKHKSKEIADMDVIIKDKTEKFNKDLGEWMGECGMPNRFQIIDVIDHFWKMQDKCNGK